MRALAPEGRLLKLTHYLLFLEPVRSKLQPNRFSHKRLPLQPHFPVPCWSLTVARHLSFVIPQRSEGICFCHSLVILSAAKNPRICLLPRHKSWRSAVVPAASPSHLGARL